MAWSNWSAWELGQLSFWRELDVADKVGAEVRDEIGRVRQRMWDDSASVRVSKIYVRGLIDSIWSGTHSWGWDAS
jgi:hypothetical protein